MVGNPNIDVIPLGKSNVEDFLITLEFGGIAKQLEILDGPVGKGGQTIANDIPKLIEGLEEGKHYLLRAGGGSVVSALTLRRFRTDNPYNVDYHNLAEPHPVISSALEKNSIDTVYYGQVPLSHALVIGWKGDKLILKTKGFAEKPPLPRSLDEVVYSSDSVLINAARDSYFVEKLLNSGAGIVTPLYFTPSIAIPPDFVFERMAPRGEGVFNYEQLVRMHGYKLAGSDEDNMQLALEIGKKMVQDKAIKRAFVTLDGEGAYCISPEEAFQVVLKEEKLAEIRSMVLSNPISVAGAGDAFLAIVAHEPLINSNFGRRMSDVAFDASRASLRHIGYTGPLPNRAFAVYKK